MTAEGTGKTKRQRPRVYEFGPYRLDPASLELTRGGEPIEIKSRAFELLLALVENAGRPVGRRELMERVWPEKRIGENSLAQAVCELRRTLGPGAASLVRTHHDRGYQLVADVRRVPRRPPSARRDARCSRCGSGLVPGRVSWSGPGRGAAAPASCVWARAGGGARLEVSAYRCGGCGAIELLAPGDDARRAPASGAG